MLSHPTHAINPRKSSFTRHFVQPHITMRKTKMQNPIYQNLLFLAAGGLLFYGLSQHYIGHSTAKMCSTINAMQSNYLIEIAILIATVLIIFALWTLWLFFKPLLIVGIICIAAVTWYATSEPDLSPVKISTPGHREHHQIARGG